MAGSSRTTASGRKSRRLASKAPPDYRQHSRSNAAVAAVNRTVDASAAAPTDQPEPSVPVIAQQGPAAVGDASQKQPAAAKSRRQSSARTNSAGGAPPEALRTTKPRTRRLKAAQKHAAAHDPKADQTGGARPSLGVSKPSMKRTAPPRQPAARAGTQSRDARMVVQRVAPDWRGFIPVLGPLLYMLESLHDAVHGFFGAGSEDNASRHIVRATPRAQE